MCFTVVPLTPLRKVIAAAQNVQALLDDGTIPNAFNNAAIDQDTTLAVTAFDVLAEQTANLAAELRVGVGVSPFLRYRREILAEGDMGAGLRKLSTNLWGGSPHVNLGCLFMNSDEHHTRIALEMIASYTKLGENDSHFMALNDELVMRAEGGA